MSNDNGSEIFINPDTGEYIRLEDGDRLKIIKKSQIEAIEKNKKTSQLNKEMKEWNNELGGFIFVLFKYCDNILIQHKEILIEDITKLFYLATYVNNNGYLVYNNKYMRKDDIQILLNMCIEKFSIFFKKMINLNIFIQDNQNNIIINKEYFTKGSIDKDIKKYYDYTRMYIKTIRYLFENVSIRDHRRLGNYFKIIPYIHRQQNVLCRNPESKIEDIQLMTLYDLKDVIGYSKNGIKGFIKEMLSIKLENGESIIGFFVTDPDFWKSVVIVNPKVFYGGNFNIKDGKQAVTKWFSGLIK
jgi:hypothetical protein